jgi:predicted transcriptional regulator
MKVGPVSGFVGLCMVVLAVLAVEAAVLVTPAPARNSASQSSAQKQDAVIKRAFRDILKREPTSTELRRYRSLMSDAYWTESEVREDVRSLRGSGGRSGSRDLDYDRIIRRAYQDILHREPDSQGLRHYRIEMIDNGWTEQDVRRALRASAEHDKVREESADRVVRRAYQDLLGREPDQRGLERYRNEILKNGWTEQQVREALRKSPEYRQKNAMTRAKAEEIVNRAYRSVLGRDADTAGMEGYVQRVLRDKWTEADVARELRKSAEYKKKR